MINPKVGFARSLAALNQFIQGKRGITVCQEDGKAYVHDGVNPAKALATEDMAGGAPAEWQTIFEGGSNSVDVSAHGVGSYRVFVGAREVQITVYDPVIASMVTGTAYSSYVSATQVHHYTTAYINSIWVLWGIAAGTQQTTITKIMWRSL